MTSSIVSMRKGNTTPNNLRSCDTVSAGAFFPQPSLDVPQEAMRQHAREYGHTCPVVLDREHALVRRAGATMVPEAALFAPDGARK